MIIQKSSHHNSLNFVKLLRRKLRKTIKEDKKLSKQNYVNQKNSSTKTNKI